MAEQGIRELHAAVDSDERTHALMFATYLHDLVYNGHYERAHIVNRVFGRERPIAADSPHFSEWLALDSAFNKRHVEALKRMNMALAPVIQESGLMALVAQYMERPKVLQKTLAHLGVRHAPLLFKGRNTLLIVHGNWPVVSDGLQLIRNYPKRTNLVTIVHVNKSTTFRPSVAKMDFSPVSKDSLGHAPAVDMLDQAERSFSLLTKTPAKASALPGSL